MTKVKLIYACSLNRVIGKNGAIPWYLPEDLAKFKRLTLGHTVLMGRKTWESLPEKVRPLPGRTNVGVTHNKDYFAGETPVGVTLTNTPELYLRQAMVNDKDETIWVIGGESLYRLALPLADEVHETLFTLHIEEGDAFAPDTALLNRQFSSSSDEFIQIKDASCSYTNTVWVAKQSNFLNEYEHIEGVAVLVSGFRNKKARESVIYRLSQPARHEDVKAMVKRAISSTVGLKITEGFYTNKHGFLNRTQAMTVAKEFGQLNHAYRETTDTELQSIYVW
jgi:dihydrofolate reductase